MNTATDVGPLADLIGGEIDHLGIAVPDLASATRLHCEVLGMAYTGHKRLEADGLDVTFLRASRPDLCVELICPLPGSHPLRALLGSHTVQDFLERQPEGGLHHVCFRTRDFPSARRALERAGILPLGDGKGATGAAGRPIMFFSPSAPASMLIELKEIA